MNRKYIVFLILSIFVLISICSGQTKLGIEKIDNKVARGIFRISESDTIYYAGLANIGLQHEAIPFVIHGNDLPLESAFIELKLNKVYKFEIDKFSGVEINAIFVEKVIDSPYPQLIIDYSAGSVADSYGWATQSNLYIISWINGKFKIIFDHVLLLENHYKDNKGTESYSYSLADGKIIMTNKGNGTREEYLWKQNRFIKKDNN